MLKLEKPRGGIGVLLYNIVLFIHILGAVIMFVAVAFTLLAMISMLYSTKTEGLRNWAALAVKLDGLLPFSVILILVPGLYLVFTSWGWGNSWVDISLALLLIMTFMGPIINLRRLKSILNGAIDETELIPSAGLLEKVRDRILWNSVLIMTMLTISILFLMTVKLTMSGSIVTIVVAIILGLLIANILISRATKTFSSSNSNTTSMK
ncbi:hypothetical protein QFZ87_002725 [Bacillus sp. SLBN-46]|uniref:hypothetical protein n=1 Tax=Bacillus sp. SLBN-46 TaxID=3042283 RepID=UPI002867519A|nr:hypothetical protein [Bacillus sp. SLBN-46]MDR6123128.1 hypothetical protein [Bacillus sp. SLBN-46]